VQGLRTLRGSVSVEGDRDQRAAESLRLSDGEYAGAGCTGCGICFMVCPEPGAITVLRSAKSQAEATRAAWKRALRERANAQATDEGQ
jgi:ferredoxin